MQELNSEITLQEKCGRDKQHYVKPCFVLITLIADKVLGLCKLTTFPQSGYCEEIGLHT